jgi:hypothetical protein
MRRMSAALSLPVLDGLAHRGVGLAAAAAGNRVDREMLL